MTALPRIIKLATYPTACDRPPQLLYGVELMRVPYGTPADITYQRYTADFRHRNARPYKTSRSAYGSLEAAIKAIIKEV